VDFYIIPQCMIHLGGAKIWFIWPANEYNLKLSKEVFLTGFGSPSFSCILQAMSTFDSLSVRLVRNPESVFVVPAGAIHAILTLERSCHCSALLSLLDDFPTAIKIMEFWITEWVSHWDCVESGQLSNLTPSEMQQSTAPKEIAHALCTWANFFASNRLKFPNQCATLAAVTTKFINVCQGKPLKTPIDDDNLERLKFIAEQSWDNLPI
jgi:hypothetical protein